MVDVTAEAAEVADFWGETGYFADSFDFLDAEEGDTAGDTARFLGGLTVFSSLFCLNK